MVSMKDAATEFLGAKRIAVTGVSRTPAGHGGNTVFTGLRKRGFAVVPVNPNADEVEGVACYPSLTAIPEGVDAVVVAAPAASAEATVREAAALGIKQIWLHRAFGGGSLSPAAVAAGHELGVRVIPGGCPLMFGNTADGAHRMIRGICRLTGAVPRQV